MDAINAWCSLDECCEFLEVPRWMLLMPGAPWMNDVILGGPQMDAIDARCSLDECC